MAAGRSKKSAQFPDLPALQAMANSDSELEDPPAAVIPGKDAPTIPIEANKLPPNSVPATLVPGNPTKSKSKSDMQQPALASNIECSRSEDSPTPVDLRHNGSKSDVLLWAPSVRNNRVETTWATVDKPDV
ncbi:hypothetical protein MKEN_00947800 [Mycena kentingensis (nom. inval.)]|nr:hypothetical protein MKEN_00947800 [Mycena kentingensis (nom. inval.)]